MIAVRDSFKMSPEEFLAWEETQPLRYEYLNGYAYAMTGGTLDHNAIAVNLTTALHRFLKGKPCRVYMNDAKVQVARSGPYYYPDVVVTCNSEDLKAKKSLRNPLLIVEVLSPSTAKYDMERKFREYQKLESLQEYVLIDTESPIVSCFRRYNGDRWEIVQYGPDNLQYDSTQTDIQKALEGTTLKLTSLGFEISFSDLYEDIEFEIQPIIQKS